MQSKGVMRFPAALRLVNSVKRYSFSNPFLNVANPHRFSTCHIWFIPLYAKLNQTQENKK